jgi:isovaleryl-CoA dehydrogenase
MVGRAGGPADGWLDFAQPDLRPEHAVIRELAHEFAERRLRPQAARMDAEDYFPRDLFAAAGEAGLIGIALPEELGGGGLDLLAAGIVREELARVSPAFAASVVASGMYFGYNIAKIGTAAQRERWLPAIAAGELIGGWALTEPAAGSDARAISTTTTHHGDQVTVRGTKCFITNAPVADVLIVQTQVKSADASSPGGYQSVVVERGLPGVSFGPPLDKVGFRGSPTGDVFLDDVPLDQGLLLGEPAASFEASIGNLEIERSMMVFSALGIARACLEEALSYAAARTQFGRPIGAFQLVKEKIADIATAVGLLRSYAYSLAGNLQAGRPTRLAAAIGKYAAADLVLRAAQDAMQVHGGYGYTRQFPVERMWRDARLLSIGGGTSEIQKLVIAGELMSLARAQEPAHA